MYDEIVNNPSDYIDRYFIKYGSKYIGEKFVTDTLNNHTYCGNLEDDYLYKVLIGLFKDADSFLSFLFDGVLSDVKRKGTPRTRRNKDEEV